MWLLEKAIISLMLLSILLGKIFDPNIGKVLVVLFFLFTFLVVARSKESRVHLALSLLLLMSGAKVTGSLLHWII